MQVATDYDVGLVFRKLSVLLRTDRILEEDESDEVDVLVKPVEVPKVYL